MAVASTMAVALTSPKRVFEYLPVHSLCSRLLHRCDERRVLHCSATSDALSVLKQASAKLFPVPCSLLMPTYVGFHVSVLYIEILINSI